MFIVHNKHQAQTDHQRKSQTFRYGCDKKSNHPGLQNQVPWGFSVPLPDPQVGKSVLGPRTFLTVQEFLWYNCSAVCASSARQLYGGANGDLLQEGLCHMLHVPGLLQPEPPVPSAGHCWSKPPQGTLKVRSGSVSLESLGPGAHKALFEPSEHF